MNNKFSVKKSVTGIMIAASLFAGIKKTVDATNNKIIDITTNKRPRNTVQPNFSQKDIFVYPKELISTLSSRPEEPTEIMIQQAKWLYKKNYLPTPEYHLTPKQVQYLTNLRIRNHPIPHMVLVDGVEDYENVRYMKSKFNDLCLTEWIGEQKRMKINSEQVDNLFAQPGKKVWTITHDLIKLWFFSPTETFDEPEHYSKLEKDSIIVPHYHHTLQQATQSEAGDMIILRNAASGNLKKTVPEWQQNGTHVVYPHGIQIQTFLWSQIGINSSSLAKYTSNDEKKAFLIYTLMKVESDGQTRAPKTNMIWPADEQIERIKFLLQHYPDLLKIDYIITDDKKVIVNFTGVFVTHGYDNKLTAQFLFELIAYNGWKINASDSKDPAGWGRFLMTQILRAGQSAQKFQHYNSLSPLYKPIYEKRDSIFPIQSLSTPAKDRFVLYPHIILRKDVDRNENDIIDDKSINGKKDKRMDEIIQDMTEEYFRMTYNKFRGMSVSDFITYKTNSPQRTKDREHLNKEIKPYIKEYLEINGWDNIPIHTTIAIPNISNEKVRETIDKTYSIYTDLVYNKFEPESQHKYYDYLHTEIQNKSLPQFIQTHPIIKHPFVDGETKLSLAKRIVDLYDDMMSKEYPNTYHKIWLSTPDQLKQIYSYIKDAIQLPKKLQRWKEAVIYIPNAIKWLKEYVHFRDILFSPQLKDIPAKDIWLSDDIATKLEIHPTIRIGVKHILPRESYNADLLNIANTRTLWKMIGESVGMDNKNNPLSKIIYYIESEWLWQIRIENNYLGYNETINLIKNAALQIQKAAKDFWISESDQQTLTKIITLCNITIQKNDKHTKDEFERSKTDLKKLLSNIISIHNSPTDIWGLLTIKIIAQTIEWNLRRYWNVLNNSLQWNTLNAEEVSFLQNFVLKAHQFGQSDSDKAFKIYMSTFLISRGAIYNDLSQSEKEAFFKSIAQLHNIIKKDPFRNSLKWVVKNIIWEKDRNNRWYSDLLWILNTNLQDSKNTYIAEIITYLKHKDLGIIPHYNKFKNIHHKPWSTVDDLPEWIYITGQITDQDKRPMLQEFNAYINHTLEIKDWQSALYLFIISLLGSLYYKKQDDIT